MRAGRYRSAPSKAKAREQREALVVLHTAATNTAAQKLFERLGFRRTMIELTRESA